MTTLEFLTLVWPREGWYCLGTPWTPPGAAKATYVHKTFATIEAATAFVKAHPNDNILFCVSSLHERFTFHPTDVDKNGDPRKQYRTHDNMWLCRILFFDVDVGESTAKLIKYADKTEARTAIGLFLSATGLPQPTVVSSGGGYHIYWPFMLDMTMDVWKPLAEKFFRLAKHHGLKVDPSRTTDQSSFLRVVGSFHHKTKTPIEVVTVMEGEVIDLKEFEAKLDELLAVFGDTVATPAKDIKVTLDIPGSAPANMGELGEIKPVFDGVTPTLDQAIESCEQLADFTIAQGDVPQNFWYGMLGVVHYLEDGDKLVHSLSAGHPNYAAGETNDKVAQWVRETKGPATCHHIWKNGGADVCERCPAFGDDAKMRKQNPLIVTRKDLKKASLPPPIAPLHLLPPAADQTTVPAPWPFKRVTGGVTRDIPGKGEKPAMTIFISRYDMYPVHSYRKTEIEDAREIWIANLPLEGDIRIEVPSAVYANPGDLCGFLRKHGVIINADNHVNMRDYMNAYIQSLNKNKARNDQYEHLGWHKEYTEFVLPDRVIRKDGSIGHATLSKATQGSKDWITKRGTLEDQVEMLEFYNEPKYFPQQLMIMASLATPMFYATNQNGMIMNMTGESGASKSTGLYTAAGIWGRPKTYVMNGQKEGGTVNFRQNRAVTLANLPVFLDELTNQEEKETKAMAMNSSQATDRGRLDRDAVEKAARVAERAILFLTTSNDSLHQALAHNNGAGTAGSMRVFEMECIKNRTGKHEADEFIELMTENYGHIGPAFMDYAVPLVDQMYAGVRNEMKTLGKSLDTPGDERFWLAAPSCALSVGVEAVKRGLLPFDVAAVRHWLIHDQFPRMRGTVRSEHESQQPLNVLVNYLASINGQMVKIRNSQAIIPNLEDGLPKGGLAAHYEMDTQHLYVLIDQFRAYCVGRRRPYLKILEKLVADGVILNPNVRYTIGKGTVIATSRAPCFVLNMDHPLVAAEAQVLSATPMASNVVRLGVSKVR